MKPTSIARKLRNNAIDAEIMLWSAIKNRKLGGFKFRRQAPIRKYVVGFVCHKNHLLLKLMAHSIWENMIQVQRETLVYNCENFV